MKYPLLPQAAVSSLTVSQLNGGINLREAASNILDNQLTDCENMVFIDGELKTRWGITDSRVLSGVLSDSDAKITPHDIFLQESGGEKARVISVYQKEKSTLSFFLFSRTDIKPLPSIKCTSDTFILTQYQSTLYLFLDQTVYTLTLSDTVWQDATAKIHIPLVAVDCKYAGGGFSGVFNESYNLLAESYRLLYTTKNSDWHNPVTDTVLHEMTYLNYYFESDYKKYAGKEIRAEILDNQGNLHTHSVVLDENGNGKETSSSDGLYMSANINGITFFTDSEYFNVAYKYTDDEQIQNDLTITFPTLHDSKRSDKVFKSTFCTWFGGGKGIYGGSRLFLGGNHEEPNLVLWSDLNNPLYFPENNFFYVGSYGRVSALKLQSDMLVIFKDSEVYYTKYAQDTTITASDVISGQVTDYLSESVYFPLTQINSNIGCDCGGTVQLCRNRLVWVNSNGRVYTLQSSDKYSENNVYEIGQLIYPKLCTEQSLTKAVCADFDGKYLLLCDKNLYVFNYNCYGYQNVAGYTKTEDANLKTEWYFCTLPTEYYKNTAFVCLDSSLFLAGADKGSIVWGRLSRNVKSDAVTVIKDDGIYAEQIPIQSMFKTKMFVFNSPFTKKDILSAFISVKADINSSFNIEYICDNFTKTAQINLSPLNTASIQNIKLYPFINKTRAFGIKVKAKGNLSVCAINIKAKGE